MFDLFFRNNKKKYPEKIKLFRYKKKIPDGAYRYNYDPSMGYLFTNNFYQDVYFLDAVKVKNKRDKTVCFLINKYGAKEIYVQDTIHKPYYDYTHISKHYTKEEGYKQVTETAIDWVLEYLYWNKPAKERSIKTDRNNN